MSNQWEQKVWGKTSCIHKTQFYSRHELDVSKGGFCSFHYHEDRANRFIIKSGRVRIVFAIGWTVTHVDLTRDAEFDVPSMVPHQFQVLESGGMVEEYWPDRGGYVENSDIVRLTKGGMLSNDSFVELLLPAPGILMSDGTLWEHSE